MLGKTLRRVALPFLVILITYGIYQYFRPIPAVPATAQIIAVPKTTAAVLPWPNGGQAALGASGYGLLAAHNADKPAPIASVAKVITALAILKQKPIEPGSQGPTLSLGEADANLFDYYYQRNGSVVQVENGEQLTEYQALEAMLLPSANNMADSLVGWAFGSTQAYVAYANQMVKQMGLNDTKVSDASGFSDHTTSTAKDLVKLGIAAINQPTISKIVGLKTADVPVAGIINNTNFLLGHDGVVGIKTGNTNKAGGCYLFAAQHTISGNKVTLVGAVLGQPNRDEALGNAKKLIVKSDAGFTKLTIIKRGDILGFYEAPWRATTQAESAKNISVLAWMGSDLQIANHPVPVAANDRAGSKVGTLSVKNGQQNSSSAILLSNNMPAPSFWWRIFGR
jgi:D-alanyl-D-alanine carboxypeptidase (penicillin-binding protein 5/6)